MKSSLKRFFIILLALVHIISLVSCGSGTPKETDPATPPEDDTPSIDLSKYTIVYSNKLDDTVYEWISPIATTLTGSAFGARIDTITDPTELEILIGQTNRPESAEALALAENENSFVVKAVGSKLVVNAHNNAMLIYAINYFTKLMKENAITSEIEYVSDPAAKLSVAKDGKTEFNLVYLTGLLTSGGTEGKCELELQLCREICDAISSTFKASPKIVEDKTEKDYEILVGETKREESANFIASLAYNEYGFEVVGKKIVVAGTNPTTTRLAAALFADTLKSFAEEEGASFNAYLYDGMRITKTDLRWNTDIPEFEGGEFIGVHDGGNGALALAYGETSAKAFEAYCEKLESEGYELYQKNEIENNLHATYTHETRGMIHTYYTASEKSVRIVSYLDGKYNLPENKEPVEYEKITEPSITGYGISGGMCFVITLADGSFIVVDSGTSDTTDRFYQLLKDLNKRPDGNILIRAWYLTHEHYDHYRMFSNFMKKYGKQITIEEFWCNPTTVDFAHYGDNRDVMWVESYDTYKKYIKGDFKWITLHTGMEFYAANMKFEVLYTEEDIFPRRCYSFNDNILVMKMTDTISGQTMLWTGDLLKRGCIILSQKYNNYLKCELLQAAHHAKSEALPLYQEVKPRVVFWPTPSANVKKADTVKGGIYAESNKYLNENAYVHFTYDNIYTVEFPVTNRNDMIIWPKD